VELSTAGGGCSGRNVSFGVVEHAVRNINGMR
jgi:hypothetical protein